MQIVDILVLATVGLVLLGGLVALGVGHRRWSIGTVVAGFLVLLSTAAFLYLAARVAERDRAWRKKIEDYQLRLAKVEHDRPPDPRAGDGPDSLARLQERRDRWQRGLDRVDTWRGRVWRDASFQPPKDDAATGRLELAAGAGAADSPPIGVGSLVFLFDTENVDDGGLYIGEFRVEGTAYDEATKKHSLTVVQTAPRDEYDERVLAQPHESVIVFEELPVDRWLAFYRSQAVDDAEDALPEPVKEAADAVRDLLAPAPEVTALVNEFVETFREHDEDVPTDEWERAERQAAEQPGTLWAEVTFKKSHALGAGDQKPPAAPDADAGAPAAAGSAYEFAEGERAKLDLQTAVALRDQDVVTIERVFRRRPLVDAMTVLHGDKTADGDAAAARGTPVLRRLLQHDIAALDRSIQQLQAARKAADDNTADERKVAGELGQDLVSWRRDVGAAGDLATALERQLDATSRALESAENAIVARGRELTAALDRLSGEIDRVAPPPERRAARP